MIGKDVPEDANSQYDKIGIENAKNEAGRVENDNRGEGKITKNRQRKLSNQTKILKAIESLLTPKEKCGLIYV